MKYRKELEQEQRNALIELRNQVDENYQKFIDIILKRGLSPSKKQRMVIKNMIEKLGKVKNNSYISQEYIPNSKKWFKEEETRIRNKRNWQLKNKVYE